MARAVIIGVILVVAFTLFSLVDCAMAPASRARGLSKPVWIVVIVLLPVVGGILWWTIGRGPLDAGPEPREIHDYGKTSRPGMSPAEVDERVRELEERLRELDNEIYPGEEPPKDPDQR